MTEVESIELQGASRSKSRGEGNARTFNRITVPHGEWGLNVSQQLHEVDKSVLLGGGESEGSERMMNSCLRNTVPSQRAEGKTLPPLETYVMYYVRQSTIIHLTISLLKDIWIVCSFNYYNSKMKILIQP